MADLDGQTMQRVLGRADALYQAIPEDQFSFDVAKAWVMVHTTL
jgi:hypothetical protein